MATEMVSKAQRFFGVDSISVRSMPMVVHDSVSTDASRQKRAPPARPSGRRRNTDAVAGQRRRHVEPAASITRRVSPPRLRLRDNAHTLPRFR
jgi:hypothetical protein